MQELDLLSIGEHEKLAELLKHPDGPQRVFKPVFSLK
jgi:hypothetical protein